MNKVMQSAAIALSLAMGTTAWASENISIPAGGTHDGSLDTRNGSIRIGEGAVIDGSLGSRNGLIKTAESVTAGSVSTRNGAIVLGANGRYGDVDSRNGGVQLGHGVEAGRVETRNGGISVGDSGRVDEIDSRNGAVAIGSGAIVAGNVRTRNGGVYLAADSLVEGRITTRNGKVELNAATANEGIRTRTGDITLKQASHSGDLVVEIEDDNDGWFGLGGSDWPEAGDIFVLEGSRVDGDVVLLLPEGYDERIPVVEISQDSHVTGSLRIDHRVDLAVAGRIDGEIERVSH